MSATSNVNSNKGLDGRAIMRAVFFSDAYRSVIFDETHNCWKEVQTNRFLSGVRRTLENECWPSYDYFAAERNLPTRADMRVATGIASGRRATTAARRGRARGTQVHTQLQLVANHGEAHMRRECALQRRPVHKFVTRILQEFKARHWTLVASEVPVFNARYGSSIDLVCVNESTQRLILIELKVGGDNYYQKYNARLEGFLAATGYSNCPLMQAMVQVSAYRVLFEQCYAHVLPPYAVSATCVLFVGESGIAVRPVRFEMRCKLHAPLHGFLNADAIAVAAASHTMRN